MSLTNREIIVRDCALWLPYCCFYGTSFPDGNTPAFTNATDPLGIVPDGWPYPASGTNIGLISGEVGIEPGANLEDEPPTDLNIVTNARYFSSYKRVVDFQVFASGRKQVRDFLNDPGARSDSDAGGGGDPNAPEVSLVLMMHNHHNPDVFLCIIHWNVTPVPQKQSYGDGQISLVKAVFKCYAGLDPNDPTCPRSGNMATWRELWIDISGNLVNADNPDTPIDPNANMKAYPALLMANIL
jgi:hypothetical protein